MVLTALLERARERRERRRTGGPAGSAAGPGGEPHPVGACSAGWRTRSPAGCRGGWWRRCRATTARPTRPSAAGGGSTAGVSVAGAGLLGLSLSQPPGSPRFYGLTLGVAGTWLAGGLASGPLHLGWTCGAAATCSAARW